MYVLTTFTPWVLVVLLGYQVCASSGERSGADHSVTEARSRAQGRGSKSTATGRGKFLIGEEHGKKNAVHVGGAGRPGRGQVIGEVRGPRGARHGWRHRAAVPVQRQASALPWVPVQPKRVLETLWRGSVDLYWRKLFSACLKTGEGMRIEPIKTNLVHCTSLAKMFINANIAFATWV